MDVWDIPRNKKEIFKGLWRVDLKASKWGQGHFLDTSLVVLMFDLTSKKSFESLNYWKEKFLHFRNPKSPDVFPIVVIGTKMD